MQMDDDSNEMFGLMSVSIWDDDNSASESYENNNVQLELKLPTINWEDYLGRNQVNQDFKETNNRQSDTKQSIDETKKIDSEINSKLSQSNKSITNDTVSAKSGTDSNLSLSATSNASEVIEDSDSPTTQLVQKQSSVETTPIPASADSTSNSSVEDHDVTNYTQRTIFTSSSNVIANDDL